MNWKGKIVQLKTGSHDMHVVKDKGKDVIVAWPIADAKIFWLSLPKGILIKKA